MRSSLKVLLVHLCAAIVVGSPDLKTNTDNKVEGVQSRFADLSGCGARRTCDACIFDGSCMWSGSGCTSGSFGAVQTCPAVLSQDTVKNDCELITTGCKDCTKTAGCVWENDRCHYSRGTACLLSPSCVNYDWNCPEPNPFFNSNNSPYIYNPPGLNTNTNAAMANQNNLNYNPFDMNTNTYSNHAYNNGYNPFVSNYPFNSNYFNLPSYENPTNPYYSSNTQGNRYNRPNYGQNIQNNPFNRPNYGQNNQNQPNVIGSLGSNIDDFLAGAYNRPRFDNLPKLNLFPVSAVEVPVDSTRAPVLMPVQRG